MTAILWFFHQRLADDFISEFAVSKDKVRFAVTTFGERTKSELTLDKYSYSFECKIMNDAPAITDAKERIIFFLLKAALLFRQKKNR